MVINEFDQQGMHCKHCKFHIVGAAAQNHHFSPYRGRIPLYSSTTRSIMALWITIRIPRFGFIDFHTNLYMEQCLQAQKPCSRSKSSCCLRGATAEFHGSSATYSIMALWATIFILRFRFIDFHTNLYLEQCFHPHKPCSRPKSPLCTRRWMAEFR